MAGAGPPGSRKEHLDVAKQVMKIAQDNGIIPARQSTGRTSYPAEQFSDPVDHEELTDVARGIHERFVGEPDGTVDGFEELTAERRTELIEQGHDPNQVGAWAASDVIGDLDQGVEQQAQESEFLADAQRVAEWARDHYGPDAWREWASEVRAMDDSDADAAWLELDAAYQEAGGEFSEESYDPGALLEQQFDADADGDPGTDGTGEIRDWAEQNFEGGMDALVAWLDELPEDQRDVELGRLDSRYEAWLAGEVLPVDVLEAAGWDADQVGAWLDGMAPDEQSAALSELLGHVDAGGQPPQGWAAGDGQRQDQDQDQYADDGYQDQGGGWDQGDQGGGEFAGADAGGGDGTGGF